MSQTRRRHAARKPLLSAAIAIAFAIPLAAQAAGPKPPTDYDQFIVKFKDTSPEKGNATLRQARLNVAGRAQGLRVSQLRRMAVGADVIRTDRVLDPRGIKDFIGRLRADPRVEYAEVDVRVFPAFSPNDTNYASQWHYHEATAGINAPAAWDIADGTGQVVAVLDTGRTPHSDLDGNTIAGYDFITSTTASRDGDARDSNPNDEGDWYSAGECSQVNGANSSWHGTHVAGTIAAVTNNSLGVAGVAFGAKVQHVRVLGKCGGSSSDINDAIVWASGGTVGVIPNNSTPAKVINLSLGGGGTCLTSTQTAIDTAVANGATVVISAGNSNADAANFQPASCNNILTVAALDRAGARASYSNFGTVVDIAAPGGGGGNAVLSTLNAGATTQGAESYAGYNGTSMAAPHVSGVAALIRDAADDALTPAEIMSLIQTTSRAIPSTCTGGCGAGLVDAFAAVAAASDPVLTIADVAFAEGNSGSAAFQFTVSLSKPVGGNVSFNIGTANGTATAGSDYTAISSIKTITAGNTSATFDVVVQGDTTGEPDETFLVQVTNVTGPITVLDDTAVGTIQNDDPVPLANGVSLTGLSGDTGSQKFYTLQVPAGATNLAFSISGGTGDADLYVRFGSAPTLSTYDCRPFLDGNVETCPIASPQAGTYYVMLNAFSAYSGLVLTGAYTEPVDISIADVSVTEGNSGTKLLTYTVQLSEAVGWPVTYDIGHFEGEGTATAGSDYVFKSLTGETIPAGQTSKTFEVVINGDTLLEADETMEVGFTNVTGANPTDSSAIGTILNDDGPKLSVGDAAITEGNSGTKVLTFTVSLSEASASPVTYDIATANNTAQAGTDYVASSLTGQSIPAGQLSKTFSVTINGDTTVEANEILRANVTNASVPVTDAQGTGTIINDDGPVLSIADAGFVEGNSGTKQLVFTVSLSQASGSDVTYNITTNNGTAAAGTDYVANSATGVVIPAGQTSKTFSVTVNGDTAVEGNETFFVNLSAGSVSIADSQAKATITNDDGPTLSIADAALVEPDSGTAMMVFTVQLSQVAGAAVTFDFTTVAGTALAGPDYVPTTVSGLKIPAGQLSKLVSVPIKGDVVAEPTETFTASISLSNVSIKDGVGVGTIINDD